MILGLICRLGLGARRALLGLAFTAACGAALAQPVTAEELGQAAYRLEGVREPLRLKGGQWDGPPVAAGGASRAGARLLTELMARADLDGDGQEEAVVLLHHWTGGTGQFLHLAVVTRRQGRAVMVASRRVGDRVQVRDLRIEGREAVLDVVRAGPSDPACCPGELASMGWTLQRSRLVASADRGAAGRLTPAVLEGSRWALVRWSPEEVAAVTPPIEIAFEGGRASGSAGCNRFNAALAAQDVPGGLQVSAPATTRMACEGDVMQAEARLLSALAGTTSFGYHQGRLVLNWNQGSSYGALFFARR